MHMADVLGRFKVSQTQCRDCSVQCLKRNIHSLPKGISGAKHTGEADYCRMTDKICKTIKRR